MFAAYRGNILLGIYFRVGKYKKASNLFEEIWKQGGFSPTVYTCRQLMVPFGNTGREKETYSLYKYMLRDGFTPDPNFLINLFESKPHISWFDKMVLVKQIEWRDLCCFSRRWMKMVVRVFPPRKRS